ncbi:MAG: TrmB family transcriptional regulator [Acidimicrobiia bacterium]|nr:TrmB family transcriptional regulator [Acidimicrobiia bacterium]
MTSVETGLVAKLKRLGLTSYESKAYVALLGRDSFTAAQVSRQGGVPRQRVYDVLAGLVQRGLAVTRPGDVVKYSAAPPDIAMGRLVAAHRTELEELEGEAGSIIDELDPLYRSGQEQTDPLEYIEVLRERSALTKRFSEIQAGVKKEILTFTRPPYATPPQENVDGLEVSRSHLARAVYEFSVFDDPDVTEGVQRFVDAGEKARFVESLPLKLAIIDEEIVMFGMVDPVAGSATLTTVVVQHPSLALVLKAAFDSVWNSGLEFEEAMERYGPASQ